MELKLRKREGFGKNKVDKLRQEGLVPGVMYSKGNEAIAVSVVEKDLLKAFDLEGTSSIFKIDLDGDIQNVLFKEVQKHPFKNQIIHFDMYIVDMKEKLRVTIPIVLEGRLEIKVQPSTLYQIINEIEVECLPINLPSEAVVDVRDMQIGDSMLVKDLDIAKDEKIEILGDLEDTVATLSEPQEEELDEDIEEDIDMEVPTVAETEEAETQDEEE